MRINMGLDHGRDRRRSSRRCIDPRKAPAKLPKNNEYTGPMMRGAAKIRLKSPLPNQSKKRKGIQERAKPKAMAVVRLLPMSYTNGRVSW